MNRALKFLGKYDENLTIAQLKQAVIEEDKKSAEKEQEEIQEVKKKIRKGWCDGSFSAEELRKMTKITKEEYQEYLNKYNNLTKELKTIINL